MLVNRRSRYPTGHDERDKVPVIVVKTSPKCKLCQHPERQAIDAELELRSNLMGKADENGVVHNIEYVLGRFREIGVENPTADNIKNHWGNERKHSYPATVEEAAQQAIEEGELSEQQLEVVKRILPDWPDVTPTPEQILELQRALFPYTVIQNIKNGKPLGITWDQVDRGINTATRRNSEEQAASLIGSLAGAIEESARTAGKAVDAVLGKDELPIIEAEVIEPKEIPESVPDSDQPHPRGASGDAAGDDVQPVE